MSSAKMERLAERRIDFEQLESVTNQEVLKNG